MVAESQIRDYGIETNHELECESYSQCLTKMGISFVATLQKPLTLNSQIVLNKQKPTFLAIYTDQPQHYGHRQVK